MKLTDIKTFAFKGSMPKLWQGRYSRPWGETSTFKIKYTEEHGFWPVVEWDISEGRSIYLACDCNSIEELIKAVNKVKIRISGKEGGAFVINEFGQVIVPTIWGNGERFLVGEVEGLLLFEDLYGGEIIDLSDDAGLQTNDPWDKPYVGVQYNLRGDSNICYYDNKLGSTEYPPEQDRDLIKKLRKVRRYGAATFIVNQYGLVLTKIPEGEYQEDDDKWLSVYVGRINYNLWFKKEE